MNIETKRKMAAILQILQQSGNPVGSSLLAKKLKEIGINLKPRMIRNYLQAMDEAGFTENLGRRGRRITDRGRAEFESALVIDKVGLVVTRLDELAYSMDLDVTTQTGTVVLNISTVSASALTMARPIMAKVMDAGLGMGWLAAIAGPGSVLGDFEVPSGKVAIGTVCSVTLNGALVKAGIPVISRFGGLLEYRAWKPLRVVHMISYDGSTLDPLEIFIRGKMTQVLNTTRAGNGMIGASFREVPAAALAKVHEVTARLREIGLGGVLAVGEPNQPLLDIPVRHGSAGLIVAAGLNPAAALMEAGLDMDNAAMAVLYPFRKLIRVAGPARSRRLRRQQISSAQE